MPGPFKLLLTTAKDTGMATYEHSLYCVALSAGIAARLKLSDHDAQRMGANLGKLGRILAVADTAAAIIANNKSQSAGRLAVALRIVPSEYDRAVCQTLTEVLDTTAMSGIAGADDHCLLRIREIVERLERAIELAASLVSQASSKVAAETGSYVLAALNALSKALSATGAVEASRLDKIAEEAHLMAEIHLVSREVDWRLRNLARNVYCRVYLLDNGSELPFVEPLLATLDSPSVKPTQNAAP